MHITLLCFIVIALVSNQYTTSRASASAFARPASPKEEQLPPIPLIPHDPFPHIGVPEPAYLDFIMHNMNLDSPDFTTLRVSNCLLDVNEVHLRMAKHVERKLFWIVSISATERAYVVICDSRLSYEQLNEGTDGGFFPGVW